MDFEVFHHSFDANGETAALPVMPGEPGVESRRRSEGFGPPENMVVRWHACEGRIRPPSSPSVLGNLVVGLISLHVKKFQKHAPIVPHLAGYFSRIPDCKQNSLHFRHSISVTLRDFRNISVMPKQFSLSASSDGCPASTSTLVRFAPLYSAAGACRRKHSRLVRTEYGYPRR